MSDKDIVQKALERTQRADPEMMTSTLYYSDKPPSNILEMIRDVLYTECLNLYHLCCVRRKKKDEVKK